MAHRTYSFGERGACAAVAICASILLNACGNLPAPSGPVTRVVLLWLKHPERTAERAQLIRAARSLRMIPGVQRVEVRRAVPSPPPAMDRSFDLGVVITFRDRTALERYEEDPRHHDAVHRYLRPLVQRYEHYDLSSR